MNYFVDKYKNNKGFRLLCQVLFLWAVSRFLMLVMMIIYNICRRTNYSLFDLMNHWDALRYRYIVDNGYTFPLDNDPQANWAFFPMYMIICAAVKLLTFWKMDTYLVGMIVSNVCIIIAAVYACKLVGLISNKDKENDNRQLFIAALMFFMPYTFYSNSMYTEAAFIMFIVLCFYFCKTKKFFLAGLMSACASGTRIVGCLLVLVLIIEMYIDMYGNTISFKNIGGYIVNVLKAPKKMLSVLICPLGIFSYMTFLNFFNGDAWAFKNVQIAWRRDDYGGFFGVMYKACTNQIEPRYTYMAWICVVAFAIYGYLIYRKHYSMGIFGIVTLFVPLTSHVLSACRFIYGTFVIFVGVYELLTRMNNIILKRIIVAALFIWEMVLLVLWFGGFHWLM